MEDRTFELLTKLYSEFSEFRKETIERLDTLENGQKKLENGQKRLEVIIENEVKNDVRALYDGYRQTYEKLEVLEDKVDNLSQKVEKQDVEIRVIKGGK